jgi:hypothetical protein
MPDFIDQLFDGAQNNGGFVDASREELLKRTAAPQQQLMPKPQRPKGEENRVAGQNVQQRGGADFLGGAAKWVEENVGIPVQDLVDNVFQGDQKTPDQIAKERAASRVTAEKEFQKQRTAYQGLKGPVKTAIEATKEVGGVIAGGMTGAAESVLNTAEIAGDSGKWLANLGRVKEDQKPWSSKYEWASWDLGKDEAGAQTGVGKIAQGFLEFATLAAATGGFGGLEAAGAKFAAASTNLGKAGVVAKAGLIGGRSGVAADMMSATRGEGNLSNLIKENAPEWYPTWLTALAVDEDDSPYEAMLKTAFDGFGVAFAGDAVGAFIGGTRAVRRALKAGATEEAAAAAGEQVFKEKIDSAQPVSSVTSTQPLDPQQYVQRLEEVKAADPATYWSVDSVDPETVAKSERIVVDGGYGLVAPDGDIKGVFKDPTATRKGVADDILRAAVAKGGMKLDNFDTYLTKVYERNGFVVVGRTPFNADYAPPGWDEALHGRPDVVAMVYDPNGYLKTTSALQNGPRKFYQYSDLITHRDRLLDTYRILQPVKRQLATLGDARTLTMLPNGAQVKWLISVDRNVVPAFGLPEGTPAFDISWDVPDGTEFSSFGRRVMTDFNRIAREHLPPGSVLINSPAGDAYGLRGASPAQSRRAGVDNLRQQYIDAGGNPELRAERWDASSPTEQAQLARISGVVDTNASDGIRARLYQRAGFGPVTEGGSQAAVVRSAPDGRGRWLQPVDLDNPQEANRLIGAQGTFIDRANRSVGNVYDNAFITSTAEDFNANFFRNQESRGYTQNAFRADYGPNASPWGQLTDSTRRDVLSEYATNAGPNLAQQRLAALQQQSSQGLPITWDDVANVVPDRFTPGATPFEGFYRNLENEIRFINNRVDGWSALLNPKTGDQVSYYAVRIDDNAILRDLTPDGLDTFAAQHADVLSRDDALLRATWNKELDVPEIQLVRAVTTEEEARFLGDLFDQSDYVDVSGRSRPLLGGESLEGTTGNHYASQMGTPMESRTVDSTTAIQQQMQLRAAGPEGPRGVSQRTVTTAQLRRIARAIGDQPGDLLRQMVRENPVNLNELSSVSRQSVDEVVNEAARGMQEALGTAGDIDFSKILRQNVGEDELLTRAGIVQVRGLMQEVSSRLYESGYAVMKLGEANMETFPQVQRMADDLKALMKIHKESANAYSKYLSTYKIKVPALGIEIDNPFTPPTVEEIAKEIKNAEKVLDQMVKDLASGDPQARAEAFRVSAALVLNEGDPSKMPTLWKYIREIATGNGLSIMYDSMLSGPKTHEINLLSNAINTIYRPIAAATGGDLNVKRAAAASFYGFHKTLQESFKIASIAMKDGPINDGDKAFQRAAETNEKLLLLQRSAEVSGDDNFRHAVGFLGVLKDLAENPVFSWPSKLLTTSDEFFKTMLSRMEYNSQTMLRAIEESTGSSDPTKQIFERMLKADLEKNFDPKTGKILNPDLINVAKEATFQTDLEGPAKAFASMMDQIPALRIFFPFVKTGHNILVYTATHVPKLNGYLSEYKAVMNGTDEYAKAVYRGREAYGTMLLAAGGIGGLMGVVVGNGPPDPNERKIWASNHQPRSIDLTKLSLGRIKGENGKHKFMDIGRLEPFGSLMVAAADLSAMFQAGQLSEDRAAYLRGYLTYAIASNFTGKSYMQGLVPLGQALTPGWQGLKTLENLPLQVANNFVPLSGYRRSQSNAMSAYMQEYNSEVDRLLYQATGGLINKGAITYDYITGEKVQALSGGVNSLMPVASTERGGNKVKDALERIEFDNSFIIKSLSGVKLNAQQRSRLQQLMGESGMQKELEAWVTHPEFEPAVQDFKARLDNGERVYKENQPFYNYIVQIMSRYRDSAVQQIKQEFPELNQAVSLEQFSRFNDRRSIIPTQ